MKKQAIIVAALLLAWGGFNWLRYDLASNRIWECYGLIRYRIQQDVCVRDAIETRDSVITWALGVPLALLIGAFALVFVLRQVRVRPD